MKILTHLIALAILCCIMWALFSLKAALWVAVIYACLIGLAKLLADIMERKSHGGM
jgi:hypothetical protein